MVIVRSGENDTLVALVRQALATPARSRNDSDSEGLDRATIDQVLPRRRRASWRSRRTTPTGRPSAAILSLVLYLVLLLLMIQAANGVAIEKANRISEVLLAVVDPASLLLRQGDRRRPGRVRRPGRRRDPGGREGDRGWRPPRRARRRHRRWARRGSILGLVLYLTIAGALGALVERQEEAGSVLTPAEPPARRHLRPRPELGRRQLRRGARHLPVDLADRHAVPHCARDASPVEIVASLAVGLVTVVFVVRLGAAIYRRGIVHTGRRMRLGEIFRT